MDEETAAALAHARGLVLRKLTAGYRDHPRYELRQRDGRRATGRGLTLDDIAMELAALAATDDG